MKNKLILLLVILFGLVIWQLKGPVSVFACNFAAGESWCGNCGYTCIQGWQSCPGTSQCGGAGQTDLRTVEPDTSTGGGGGVVPDGSGGYKPKETPPPAPKDSPPPANSTTCSGSYPTAVICRGKQIGYKDPATGLVCVRTTGNLCAANYSSSSVGDTDKDGISGSIISNNAQDQARGACPFVITCNCNGTQKQQCQDQNLYNSTQVEGHCRDHVCPAIGTNGKVCDPGTVKCLNDGTSKGYVCNNAGTAWNSQPVSAHACGATHTTVSAYCVTNPNGTPGRCYTSLNGCNQNVPAGGQCRTNTSPTGPIYNEQNQVSQTPDQYGTKPIPNSCTGKPSGTRYFAGCGGPNNTYNCYIVCNGSGGSSRVCEASQLSCGSRADQQPTPTPSNKPRDNTNPPASPRPAASPTPTTTVNLQCTSVTKSIAKPKIGDKVAFTCTASAPNLVTKYEFRYGVITTAGAITADKMKALGTQQGKPRVSQPITVDKVGRYFAQCRPCTANKCLAWENASQITVGEAK